MHELSERLMHWQLIYLAQERLTYRWKYYAPQVRPDADLASNQDLQIMNSTVHAPEMSSF